MTGSLAVFAVCALPLAFARVVAPATNAPAGPSTLELTDILEKAVVLMEKGTEKLVQDARIQEARLSASAGAAGAAEAQENVGAMQKILKDFRSLHLIAEKLHGRYSSESQQLKADRDDKGSLLVVAQSRTKTLEHDNAMLQAMLKDEMKNTEKCSKELRNVQNCTNTCDAVKEKDAGTIKQLEEKTASLESQLNTTKTLQLQLQTANDKLSSQVMDSSKENAALKSQLMALQSRLDAAEATEKTLNTTVQDYSEKLALAKDAQEDTEEEKQSAAEAFKELNASFASATHQLAVKQEDIITAQKAMDIANSDKSRLLDSVRMLMHENDDFQRRLLAQSRGEVLSPAEGGSPSSKKKHHKKKQASAPNAAAGAAPAATLAGHNASNASAFHAKYDTIEWMNKTKKIDEYLSRLSPTEAELAAEEQAAAPTPPPAPLAPLLTDYLNMPNADVKEASKEAPAIEHSVASTTTTERPIARYLRATTVSPAGAGGAPSAAATAQQLKQVVRAKQDEEELASMKDIQEANTLYSEAERLIQSASD